MNLLVIIVLVLVGIFLLSIYLPLTRKMKFPFIQERYPYECGPRCLEMIANYYGKEVDFETIAIDSEMSKEEGSSLIGLTNAAKKMGFKTLCLRLPFYSTTSSDASIKDVRLPCILHWEATIL